MGALSLTLLSVEKPGRKMFAAGPALSDPSWQACRSEQACLALLVWCVPPCGLLELGGCLILAGRARNVLVQDFAYLHAYMQTVVDLRRMDRPCKQSVNVHERRLRKLWHDIRMVGPVDSLWMSCQSLRLNELILAMSLSCQTQGMNPNMLF